MRHTVVKPYFSKKPKSFKKEFLMRQMYFFHYFFQRYSITSMYSACFQQKIEASTRNGMAYLSHLSDYDFHFSVHYFPREKEKWLLNASLGLRIPPRTGGMTAGPAGDTGAGGGGVW